MSASAVPHPRILIADDSDVCRTVLAILLKNTGFDVTSVVNGTEALAKLRAHPFELVVLDNDMPGLDGLATLAALRTFAPEIPVVIISGTLSPALRARYETHRIAAIFDKPVDPRKLRDQIPSILTRRTQGAKAEVKGTVKSASVAVPVPLHGSGEADAALENPAFAGGSAQARKLVADFDRIRDFRSAATITGCAGAAFLDIAVALAEKMDAVLLACSARQVTVAHLTKLFAPSLLHQRPVLLIVLEADKLSHPQQDLLEEFLAGGGVLSMFNGRARVILCAQAALAELADAGEFNEMLLMRAGAMKLVIPGLARRHHDLPEIARAVLRRVGAATVKLSPEARHWLEATTWSGGYVQLHRTVEIALKNQPTAERLDLEDLEKALADEATWTAPLFLDMLGYSLGLK